MSSFLAFLVIFSVVVVVHEAGHFLAARFCGLLVSEFSIGFPFSPRIMTLFRHNGTEFTLRLLPLGGFVSFSEDGERGFGRLSWLQKLGVIAAGPGASIAFAWALFSLYFGFTKDMSLVAGTVTGFSIVCGGVTDTMHFFLNLLNVPSFKGLTGPVGIAVMAGTAASNGLWSATYFTAALSLSLGILNLLPLPSLDGGHILTILAERVKGSPFNRTLLATLNVAGIALFLLLTSIITFKEVSDLLS